MTIGDTRTIYVRSTGRSTRDTRLESLWQGRASAGSPRPYNLLQGPPQEGERNQEIPKGETAVRKRFGVIGLVVLVAAVGVLAQVKERASGRSEGAYRVTPWPDHADTNQRYSEEIETYLNRMAADGWRFHSELVGQFGKAMLFERASGR